MVQDMLCRRQTSVRSATLSRYTPFTRTIHPSLEIKCRELAVFCATPFSKVPSSTNSLRAKGKRLLQKLKKRRRETMSVGVSKKRKRRGERRKKRPIQEARLKLRVLRVLLKRRTRRHAISCRQRTR